MKNKFQTKTVRKFLLPNRDIDAMRIYYCYQIGSTFVALGLMESQIISAMMTCNRIKLARVIHDDITFWDSITARHKHLQSSTLGNLIQILSKHGISERDLNYLRWVKGKRDYFVHRFFEMGAWPGDTPEEGVRFMCRRLLYLEHVFRRADNRIYRILHRAGLVEIIDLGVNGYLISNVGSLSGDGNWLRNFAIAATVDHAEKRGAEDEAELKDAARPRRARRKK
jgi:hypothetical protein